MVAVGDCYSRRLCLTEKAMPDQQQRRRLKVPEQARRGELFTVKCLAEHDMETGIRVDQSTGAIVPRMIIRRVECRYNDELVFFADWFQGVSANPYLTFKLRATDSGPIEVRWIDDADHTTTAIATIEVVDDTG